jgi:hypothetical protein
VTLNVTFQENVNDNLQKENINDNPQTITNLNNKEYDSDMESMASISEELNTTTLSSQYTLPPLNRNTLYNDMDRGLYGGAYGVGLFRAGLNSLDPNNPYSPRST